MILLYFLILLSLLPLLILIGVLNMLTCGFPVFYSQRRVGLNGSIFTLYKFRTMVKDAESLKKSLIPKNEANGPVFKIREDPRYTGFGRFLAHTGLDELPQLWNVLRGDMALIGPRPLPIEEAAKLKPWQQKRHAIKPGIISPWILHGYHSMKFDDWMKSDIAYIKQKSFWYDFRLAMRTVKLLLSMFIEELRISVSR